MFAYTHTHTHTNIEEGNYPTALRDSFLALDQNLQTGRISLSISLTHTLTHTHTHTHTHSLSLSLSLSLSHVYSAFSLHRS